MLPLKQFFNVGLNDDGPFSSSQRRSLSASSFYATLILQAIDRDMTPLALCLPACSVSSSSTLQIFRDAIACDGLI